jgi:formylglycine-generating enzyme required for sulfatase activity
MGKLLRFLVLACVVQVAGAQGLFKGFVPDENGTNLDAPIQKQKLAPGTIIKDCPECPEMVITPLGSFQMGSSAQERALADASVFFTTGFTEETPQHHVRVPSFAAGRYSVTKGEFAAFVRASGYRTEAELGDGCLRWSGKDWKTEAANNWRNPSFAQGDDHPVVCVSWNDTQAYIQWLNRISGRNYRLLSEAEREYVTRGGTQTAFWWGDSLSTALANYFGNASYNGSPKGQYREATVPVDNFSGNPFGLYNVHGNVWEWMQDCWHETYAGAPTDGSAWTTGCTENKRVARGGSWDSGAYQLRSASRLRLGFSDVGITIYGFRLARDIE